MLTALFFQKEVSILIACEKIRREKHATKKKLPFVTVGFVAVNVLVYVILEILGNTENSEFMVRMGAVWPPYVKQGEYWRLFTATFMHFGFEHILNNMLVLICAGPILEKAMGHIKYLCLYLIAGVGGSTLSYVQMIARGKYDVSAGHPVLFSVLSGHCCGL